MISDTYYEILIGSFIHIEGYGTIGSIYQYLHTSEEYLREIAERVCERRHTKLIGWEIIRGPFSPNPNFPDYVKYELNVWTDEGG